MNDANLYNIAAEKAILGAAMIDNTVLSELDIWGEDFYREAHREIFGVMGELYFLNQTVDIVTLQQRLNDRNMLEAVGGLAYLMQIQRETFTTAGVKDYARIIRECAIKRELLKAADNIKLRALSEDCDANSLIDDLGKTLNILTQANNRKFNATDIANNMGLAVEELYKKAEKREAGLPTNFLDFDSATGGLYPGDLLILAARPGMGKTAFALNIAMNVVYKFNKTVLIASLEMSANQLQYRLLSSMTGVELTKFRQPTTITPDEWKRLRKAHSFRTDGYLDVYANANASVSGIAHKARQCKHEHGLDLIIVDYLQLMEGDKKADGRTQEVSQISRALKTMAMELEVPVIALSQLNRGLEARQDKRPLLSDLRESGSIEQDADMVLFIYRDSYYNEDSPDLHSELKIAKNRNGPIVTIPLFFDAKIATFRNLSKNMQGGY